MLTFKFDPAKRPVGEMEVIIMGHTFVGKPMPTGESLLGLNAETITYGFAVKALDADAEALVVLEAEAAFVGRLRPSSLLRSSGVSSTLQEFNLFLSSRYFADFS